MNNLTLERESQSKNVYVSETFKSKTLKNFDLNKGKFRAQRQEYDSKNGTSLEPT